MKELKQLVRNVIAPEMGLGHSDSAVKSAVNTKDTSSALHNTGRHGFDRAYEENDESVVIVEAVDSDGDGGGSFALVPDTKGTYIDRDRGVRTRQATDGVDDVEEEMGMERYGIRILG
ncbi:hypothetical protein BGZ74_010124 [Mortierella antarctica]|nr:hypothetical protein BGZ74_010124 [Mortierella antarctica]